MFNIELRNISCFACSPNSGNVIEQSIIFYSIAVAISNLILDKVFL